MNFVEELRWRGMIQEIMPGTEEQVLKEQTVGYLGIDPTADSLHIGHLVGVMMLKHFQQTGHTPVALVGGATGMIGDPSMKSAERKLLDEDTLRYNQEAIKKQLAKFLDFESDISNRAFMVNNYDWMKDYSFLNFIRDIGKHITVNYMMAKDSVKKRISGESSEGMSFTEFSYQLLQGYKRQHLYREMGCKIQLGGSDQWGNITTGTELIRRVEGGEAFALVCPLITKADGGKFGKTESGNVWLDPARTSPYKFYQFWVNTEDQSVEGLLKLFTFLPLDEIKEIMALHERDRGRREAQRRLAREVTEIVHGSECAETVVNASSILFGDAFDPRELSSGMLTTLAGEVPTGKGPRDFPASLVDLLAASKACQSKSEARRLIKGGGLYINGERIADESASISGEHLLENRYLFVRLGKKRFFMVDFD